MLAGLSLSERVSSSSSSRRSGQPASEGGKSTGGNARLLPTSPPTCLTQSSAANLLPRSSLLTGSQYHCCLLLWPMFVCCQLQCWLVWTSSVGLRTQLASPADWTASSANLPAFTTFSNHPKAGSSCSARVAL